MTGVWPGYDTIVTKTNKAHATAFLAQKITETETETIADALLGLAQKNASLAGLLRTMFLAKAAYGAGSILGMLVINTLIFYVRNGGVDLPDLSGVMAGMMPNIMKEQ